MKTRKITWDCTECGLGHDVEMSELYNRFWTGQGECPNCGALDYITFHSYDNREAFDSEVPF